MDNEIRGYTPTIIILDDLDDFSNLVRMSGKVQALYEAYFGEYGKYTQRLADIVEMQMVRFPVEAEPYVIRDHEPLPRPSRAPVRVNQAPKQSFRKTMRSVNRNR